MQLRGDIPQASSETSNMASMLIAKTLLPKTSVSTVVFAFQKQCTIYQVC